MDLTENIIIAKLLMYQLMNRRSSVGNCQSREYLHIFSPYLHNLNFENLNFLSKTLNFTFFLLIFTYLTFDASINKELSADLRNYFKV